MATTYPFDPLGTLASNFIQNEPRDIEQGNGFNSYCIIPDAAPFYRDSFIASIDNGNSLVEGTDFYFVYPFSQAEEATGKEVYGGIVLTDPNLTGRLRLNYRTIGSPWSESRTANIVEGFVSVETALQLDWDSMPEEFPPTPHSHVLLEGLSGMDQVYQALIAIKETLATPGNTIMFDDIADIGTKFVTPVLSKLDLIAANLLSGGLSTSVLNQLQQDVAAMAPYTGMDTNLTHYTFKLMGFLEVRIGRIDYLTGAAPASIDFPLPIPNRVLWGSLGTGSIEIGDTTPYRGKVYHSPILTTGISAVNIENDGEAIYIPEPNDPDPNDPPIVQPEPNRTLYYLVIGV